MLKIQTQLERMSEWKLLLHVSQSAALEGRHRAVLQFLQDEPALSGIFPAAVMRRLQALSAKRAAAAIEEEILKAAHFSDRRCRRRSENVVRTIAAEEYRSDAADALAEISGFSLKRPAQGPRKLPERP
ncbi:MAG: hypothetical protein J2P49_07760 [Methylocapsa sp.]|nr:hypothetical protein [Methylocapsa sp.]